MHLPTYKTSVNKVEALNEKKEKHESYLLDKIRESTKCI
jgi:hypothetical protein